MEIIPLNSWCVVCLCVSSLLFHDLPMSCTQATVFLLPLIKRPCFTLSLTMIQAAAKRKVTTIPVPRSSPSSGRHVDFTEDERQEAGPSSSNEPLGVLYSSNEPVGVLYLRGASEPHAEADQPGTDLADTLDRPLGALTHKLLSPDHDHPGCSRICPDIEGERKFDFSDSDHGGGGSVPCLTRCDT